MGKKTKGVDQFLKYENQPTKKSRKSAVDEHKDSFEEIKKLSDPIKMKVQKKVKF